MHDWSPERLADAAGARLAYRGDVDAGPRRAIVDSREAGEGDLFVGIKGERDDGGRFAAAALQAGVAGVRRVAQHDRHALEPRIFEQRDRSRVRPGSRERAHASCGPG